VLLVGINAKYIHSNLAIRYLSRIDSRCSFLEYTISDRADRIAAELYQTGQRDIVFSSYIWNIELVYRVCEILMKTDCGFRLGLAGPEVSFNPEEQLLTHPDVSFVLCGEGEPSISLLVDALEDGSFQTVPGLWYRQAGEVVSSPLAPQEAVMDELPFPYTEEDIAALQNRLVYFETSRGCPYRCSFCLSGGAGSLRFLSLDKVAQAVAFFHAHNVPLVKLVDRTFNADPERALSIINLIKSSGGSTCYHLEIRAESMTKPLISALQSAPKGMFQLEIGVQSTNAKTLQNINRKPAVEALYSVVRALSEHHNMHLHLDLIAGLTGETLTEFVESFHNVIALRPQALQLGFLKRLKGAALQLDGSAFSDFPPYEIIHSDAMSYEELLLLHAVEDVLDCYYNSGAYTETMKYLLDRYYPGREFEFFKEMASFLERENVAGKAQKARFEALYRFACDKQFDVGVTHRLIYDYCLTHRDSLSFMKTEDGLKEKAFAFLKQPERVKLYFEQYAGIKPVVLYKKLRFVPIGNRVIAFDYDNAMAADVTAEF